MVVLLRKTMSHFFNGFGVWQEPNKSEDNNDENKRRKINKMESNNGKNINNGQITEMLWNKELQNKNSGKENNNTLTRTTII